MPRYAQIDNGIVTGTIESLEPPSRVPPGRSFVEITEQPTVRGGESYDARTGVFTPPPPKAPGTSKLDQILSDLGAIKAKLSA